MARITNNDSVCTTLEMEVTYFDNESYHFPLNEGWKISTSSNTLVIGRGRTRTMIPLCNVRTMRLVPTKYVETTIEVPKSSVRHTLLSPSQPESPVPTEPTKPVGLLTEEPTCTTWMWSLTHSKRPEIDNYWRYDAVDKKMRLNENPFGDPHSGITWATALRTRGPFRFHKDMNDVNQVDTARK